MGIELTSKHTGCGGNLGLINENRTDNKKTEWGENLVRFSK